MCEDADRSLKEAMRMIEEGEEESYLSSDF